MQHNSVKRVRYTVEALEAKRQRDQARLTEFRALNDEVLAKKKSGDLSKAAFDLTTRVLRINPEFYTVWNYRRNILSLGIFKASTLSEINELLDEDLSMTFAFLKHHPKVYWIWNHRKWCLENVPEGPTEEDPQGWKQANWNKELFVAEKMLETDARNFHAWSYRRYVFSKMANPPSLTSDLAYTTRKIEANFSNFSAWHQRSKVLTSLWEAGQLDRKTCLEEEFELVQNAMYTDPDDQSVWMYHAWLIGQGDDAEILKREIDSIQELLNEQPDSKWCMESIVRYKRLLMGKHCRQDSDDQRKLTNECLQLLDKLREIDPPRKRRYQEISELVERN